MLNPRTALLFVPTPDAFWGKNPEVYLEKRQICLFSTANLSNHPWRFQRQ